MGYENSNFGSDVLVFTSRMVSYCKRAKSISWDLWFFFCKISYGVKVPVLDVGTILQIRMTVMLASASKTDNL